MRGSFYREILCRFPCVIEDMKGEIKWQNQKETIMKSLV